MQKQKNFMPGLALALAILLVSTSSMLAQVQITDCMDCHNDTTVITGKQTGWSESMHGTGESYGRGTSASCAACHSGGAFSKMVADGLAPNTIEAGDPKPTRQDCRACHQIHTSYTTADWALETTDPVALYAFDDVTYDGGKGNLCANCHQPRRAIAAADPNGNIACTSTHWGPHHGPQSAVLLGIGGAGDVVGTISPHAMLVKNTCVSCHISENDAHTFEAVEASCTGCHPDADGFDVDGLQTEVAALIAELGELLVANGLLDEEGHPVVGEYPAAKAAALWNYILLEIEDGSLGVHNPGYTKALLEASVAAMKE